MLIFICVLLLFILSVYKIAPTLGPASKTSSKGYGLETESINVLLKRIKWSNNFPARINYYYRFLFISIIITFLLLSLQSESIIHNEKKIVNILVIVFLILVGTNSYFSHHCEKFKSFYIDNNVDKITKKLNKNKKGLFCKKVTMRQDLKINKKTITETNECFNYTYK